MATLEQIQQMRQQGLSDNQIIASLREQGISPKDINDALSQLEVKSAISPQMQMNQETQQETNQQPTQQYSQEQYAQQPYSQEQYQEQTNEEQYPPQYSQEQYPQNQYPTEQYAQEPHYQQVMDMETIRNIAKQIIDNELEKTKSQISEIIKLKTELKFQIQHMDNRLTKIENSMENLQSAILKKMGDYGEAVQDISKDIKSTQESFSKLINPLIDQKRGKPSPRTKKSKEFEDSENSSKETGFEDYFR